MLSHGYFHHAFQKSLPKEINSSYIHLQLAHGKLPLPCCPEVGLTHLVSRGRLLEWKLLFLLLPICYRAMKPCPRSPSFPSQLPTFYFPICFLKHLCHMATSTLCPSSPLASRLLLNVQWDTASPPQPLSPSWEV